MTVATPDRGQRRRCSSCSAPFYDLRRDPIVCPKCGATLVPPLPQRHQRPKPTPTGQDAEPAPVIAAETASEDDTDEDDAGDKDEDDEEEDDAEPAAADAEPDDEADDEPEASDPDDPDRT